MINIYKKLDSVLKHLKKSNKKLKGRIEIIKLKEESVGISFEPRLKTKYALKCGDVILGDYEHTEVFQRDGETLVTDFGMVNLKERNDIRPSWDEYFMLKAIDTSRRSSCLNVHAGTVIVDSKTNLELGSGYNGAAPGLESCLDLGYCRKERATGEKYGITHGTGKCWGTHSEQNAASHITRLNLNRFTVYATIFPCNDCTNNLLAYRGFDRVVFKSFYDEREIESSLERFDKRKVDVYRLNLSPERAWDISFNEPDAKITVWTREEKSRILEKIFSNPSQQQIN
ncbi:MAG: hypothetical protein ABH804_01650 [archaeon]